MLYLSAHAPLSASRLRCCIELRERERGRGRREGGSREAGRQGECVYEGLAHGYHRIIVHVKPGDQEPERETHAAEEL